jgi:hypothetical protein
MTSPANLPRNTNKALAAERARVLLGCYRKADAGDPEIYIPAIISVFVRYPESVVYAVTEPATGLPAKIKWPPSIAEIVEACEAEMEPIRRQRERDRLADEQQRALAAPRAEPRLTREEMEARWPMLRRSADAVQARRGAGFRSLGELAAEAGVSAATVAALPDAPK